MAIFHFSIKIFSRGKGDSAVQKAAYRAGEKLVSDHNGKTYDFTHKDGVIVTDILLPDHAPAEYKDRSVLWNEVERSENNGNAQLAREMEFSLPVELSIEQNIELAREFVQKTFVDKGMCADVCVHDRGVGNPHAHVMLTLRPIAPDGRWGAKSKKEYILDNNGERIRLPSGEYKSRKIPSVDWNEQTKAEEWRSAWADTVNAAFKQRGIATRIDHRSYERQGVDTVPSVHMGVAAMQMEQKGIRTERGDINRSVEVTNSKLRQQRARIKHAKDWLYSVPIQNPPSMLDMMNHIADSRNFVSQAKKVKNVQTYAKVLMFVQQNSVYNLEQLADKVADMSQTHYDTANEIREKNRRIGTLTTHLKHCEVWERTQGIHKKLARLDPKKRGAYEKKHAEELRQYKETTAYFKEVLNGRTVIPNKKWQAELDTLTAERNALYDKYYRLDDDLKNVEALRRGAMNIMREEPQREAPTRARGMER